MIASLSGSSPVVSKSKATKTFPTFNPSKPRNKGLPSGTDSAEKGGLALNYSQLSEFAKLILTWGPGYAKQTLPSAFAFLARSFTAWLEFSSISGMI
jgi:hypothetical protein